MRLTRAAGVALLISLALSGCVPPAAQKSPAEIAASQQADTLVQQGKFDEAAQAYLALAQTGSNRDHYQLLAAEAYRQEGQLDRAAPLLDGIRRQRLTGDEPSRLDLLQAEMALKQHNAPRALQLTTQPNISVPPALQLRLLELRSQAIAADRRSLGRGSHARGNGRPIERPGSGAEPQAGRRPAHPAWRRPLEAARRGDAAQRSHAAVGQ